MVNKTQYCVGKYMNVSNIHVFGLWEEAIVFEENVQGLHPQPSCEVTVLITAFKSCNC